jgi:hypothetical protein
MKVIAYEVWKRLAVTDTARNLVTMFGGLSIFAVAVIAQGYRVRSWQGVAVGVLYVAICSGVAVGVSAHDKGQARAQQVATSYAREVRRLREELKQYR